MEHNFIKLSNCIEKETPTSNPQDKRRGTSKDIAPGVGRRNHDYEQHLVTTEKENPVQS